MVVAAAADADAAAEEAIWGAVVAVVVDAEAEVVGGGDDPVFWSNSCRYLRKCTNCGSSSHRAHIYLGRTAVVNYH